MNDNGLPNAPYVEHLLPGRKLVYRQKKLNTKAERTNGDHCSRWGDQKV